MRYEPFSLATLLKMIGCVATLGLLWLMMKFAGLRDPVATVTYYLGGLDPVYFLFFAFVLGVVFIPPLLKLRREKRIWQILAEPFETDEDPFLDVDLRTDAFGNITLRDGHLIKRCAVHVTEEFIFVRKPAYLKLFPPFKVAWDSVTNVYFVGTKTDKRFSTDDHGIARITLSFSEETILILPWRERFNRLIPSSAGFQEESVIFEWPSD